MIFPVFPVFSGLCLGKANRESHLRGVVSPICCGWCCLGLGLVMETILVFWCIIVWLQCSGCVLDILGWWTHYTTIHYTTHHYSKSHCTSQHYTTLDYITLHYTALHYATLHNTTLHYTALHHDALHITTLHCPTLHFTTLQSITLHCTTLHNALRYSSQNI